MDACSVNSRLGGNTTIISSCRIVVSRETGGGGCLVIPLHCDGWAPVAVAKFPVRTREILHPPPVAATTERTPCRHGEARSRDIKIPSRSADGRACQAKECVAACLWLCR